MCTSPFFFKISCHLFSTIGCDMEHLPSPPEREINSPINFMRESYTGNMYDCMRHTSKCQQKCSVYDVCQKSKSDAVPENVTFPFVFLIVCFVVFFKFFFFLSHRRCSHIYTKHELQWVLKCAQPIKLVEFRKISL